MITFFWAVLCVVIVIVGSIIGYVVVNLLHSDNETPNRR